MKKIFFIIILITTILATIALTAYRSSTQKREDARAKLQYTTQNLKVTEKNVTHEEWIVFKSESELKIRDFEIQWNELNEKMKESGEISDTPYQKKIAILKLKNEYVKARLESFEQSQINWESFRLGFNNEIDTIGNLIKSLVAENKK